MRIPFATLCFALALSGCRGPGNGMFAQTTIPPPGTQPPGTLLAGNSYYPGAASTPGTLPLPTTVTPAQDSRGLGAEPNLASSSNSPITERRGASLSRASLGSPSRTVASTSQEEPIRIPDEPAIAGTLAAVVPIRGIPKTDATSLFDTVRSQLAAPSTLAARSPASSGFVEISQLPNAPDALRRAALSGQSLR